MAGWGSLAEVGPSSKLQTRPSRPHVRFFESTREYIDVNARGTAWNSTYQHKPPLKSRTLGILTESHRELLVPTLNAPQGRVRVEDNHYIYTRYNKQKKRAEGV